MLTGLPQPPFHLTRAHTQRNTEDPLSELVDPKWVAANLAYLRNLDWFRSRAKQMSGGPSGDQPPQTPKARPKKAAGARPKAGPPGEGK